MTIRSFRLGDKQAVLLLVNEAYRNLERLTKERLKMLTSPPYFCPEGFMIAEKRGLPIGCVSVLNLPARGCLAIQYLAVADAFSNVHVVDELIQAALDYAASKQPKMVKAVTLTIQPYVEAYEKFGFKPVRRILRIAWDLTTIPKMEQVNPEVTVSEVKKEDRDEAACVFVEGMQPYWDWYVEEEGGSEPFRKKVLGWLKQYGCLAAKANDKIAGVVAVIPRPKIDEATFTGVIVLPKCRMKGIGSALMNAALDRARQLGYVRLVVHTVAYLDVLAPGAVLYLKSGGKIEAEYLQLIHKPKLPA